MIFETGKTYNRKWLHENYGGQTQSGISTPTRHPVIFLFTGSNGSRHGYRDGWNENHYFYTGQGQVGDMTFTRGNRAIRDHVSNRKHIYLFHQVYGGQVVFDCELRTVGYSFDEANDTNGNMRKIIVFQLERVSD